MSLSILSESDGVPSPGSPSPGDPVKVWQFPENSGVRSQTFRFEWDTNELTPYNGRYRIIYRARTRVPNSGTQVVREGVFVDNPPRQPAPPVVRSSGNKTFNVEWRPAGEPDLISYTLYRARTNSASEQPKDSAFQVVGTQKGVTKTDQVTDPGAYWYKIQSTRRSFVTAQGIGSVLSRRSDEAGIYATPAPVITAGPAVRSRPGTISSGGSIAAARPRPGALSRNLPDAPFSTVLDYGDSDKEDGSQSAAEIGGDSGGSSVDETRRKVLPIAIGVFMVAAWAVLTRSRLLV